MKNIVAGIIAHVDAGKTTLSEAMLYCGGSIKTLGRVDRRSSFLDTHSLERERGITIFSKQARLTLGETSLTLLDTPGHSDFSSETERALQILDYAILVISGTDGVQAHTETLWRLLKRYRVPAFIFVTKCDLAGFDRARVMGELKSILGGECLDFNELSYEELALCGEELLEKYLESGTVSDEDIAQAIRDRRIFPCCFGSGLKLDGVDDFLLCLERFTAAPRYGEGFSGRVYKIARDSQGNRLSYIKVTGGRLEAKAALGYLNRSGELINEKVNELRLYSGEKFETAQAVYPGEVVAVTGLTGTFPGQGLGGDEAYAAPVLEPVLTYRIALPEGIDPMAALPKLRLLEEEDPLLRIVWNSSLREIHVQLMGQVQTEVLARLIEDRFGFAVGFDSGEIMYRETIAERVEGVGHFEPLRHYAEVHLAMEPLPVGSGLQFFADCPEDMLSQGFQRLILTHLEEKQHLGVLTGSPITDMKITLIAGRAHPKHTEGGDFRQATYRAVRQGLMRAQSVLLEPYYAFGLEIPQAELGRAINDIRSMGGTFSPPEDRGEHCFIRGRAPVSAMRDYGASVAAYTHGRGRFSCIFDGFDRCLNQEEAVARRGYDPRGDLENTPDSVFCAHGAGFNVSWDKAPEYMHIDTGYGIEKPEPIDAPIIRMRNLSIDDKELEAIMDREFGPIRRPVYSARKYNEAPASAMAPKKREYLLVDGYNVIFAWRDLNELAQDNLDLARGRLMDILANYRGYTKCELILVFDAYRVQGGAGEKSDYHGIHVAYTKMGETGDAYIEALAKEMGRNYSVRVISSDSLVQLSALGSGVLRQTAGEFENEVRLTLQKIDEALDRMDFTMRGETLGDRMDFNGKQ